VKRLLLLGGGHSHVEVLRQFGVGPRAGAEITLINPARYASYSGMLPGYIAGHYRYHECHIDLAYLARCAGARLVESCARTIDTQRQRIMLTDGSMLDYDIVSIDIGSTSAPAAVAGEGAVAVKPVEAFLPAWQALAERARRGELKKVLVIGGGAGGVELLLAIQHALAGLTPPLAVAFALITDGDRLLPELNSGTRMAFQGILSQRGIAVRMNCRVVHTESNGAITMHGERIAADAMIWAAGASAPPWLRETGLKLDPSGFIATDEHLRSLSHQDIYATGDCATIAGYTYPKSGVYAVRQGPILARNLRHALANEALEKYRPQRHALTLISTGDKYAVAAYGGLAVHGAWVWRWKDRIDRKFMARYAAQAWILRD
jgi:selenide,water dikinase